MVQGISPLWGFAPEKKPLGFTGPSRRRPSTRRLELHRFFTTFPGGLPGMGLLLLRVAVGAAMMAQGGASVAGRGQASFGMWGLGLPAILSGCALVAGFLTPGAGVLAAVVSLAGAVARPLHGGRGAFEGGPAAVLLVVMAATVALVGPGGFSLDARLFGRREIVVPRSSGRLRED